MQRKYLPALYSFDVLRPSKHLFALYGGNELEPAAQKPLERDIGSFR